jgi:hypothetical protein
MVAVGVVGGCYAKGSWKSTLKVATAVRGRTVTQPTSQNKSCLSTAQHHQIRDDSHGLRTRALVRSLTPSLLLLSYLDPRSTNMAEACL